MEATYIDYPFNGEECYTKIIGSCDGILCLIQSRNLTQLALWNPSTRKYNALPSLDKPHSLYGFGYDHFSDNYKVVAVFMYECKGDSTYVYKIQVKVHTSGTDSWRLIQEFPSVIFRAPFLESGAFVNGTINWLVAPDSIYSITLQPIVSLDFGTESYQEIMPPNYGAERVTLKFGVLKDCLCVLAGCESRRVSDIWLMKEYGKRESWTKLVTVPYVRDSDYYVDINKVLYISEDNQVLLEFKKVFESELAVYDSINSTLKNQDIENFNDFRQTEIYNESLISPCS